jgi:SP family general alpha glucoside:H+ symporter-like MFS transporter
LAGNKDPFLVTILIGVLGIVAALFDIALVDKVGRRWMTLIGFTGACTGMIIIAITGCFNYANPQLGGLLVFGGVSAGFFSTFQSTTSYAYLTEMPEVMLRARSTGFGLAFSNL